MPRRAPVSARKPIFFAENDETIRQTAVAPPPDQRYSASFKRESAEKTLCRRRRKSPENAQAKGPFVNKTLESGVEFHTPTDGANLTAV
jgi:hypothetical protein